MALVSITTDEKSARRVQPVTGHKFFLLFLFLLAYLALYPYMGDTGAHYYGFRLASAALTLMRDASSSNIASPRTPTM
jgi:hypothetical protein